MTASPPTGRPHRTRSGDPACEFCDRAIDPDGYHHRLITGWKASTPGSIVLTPTVHHDRYCCGSCWPLVSRGLAEKWLSRPDPDDIPISDSIEGPGKHRTDSPGHVVAGATAAHATAQRSELLGLLVRCPEGLTSKQMAIIMRARHGDSSPAGRVNQIATRLGELFERRFAAPQRTLGACRYGVCHPPVGHRPTTPCDLHGELIIDDRAMVWRGTTTIDP